MSKLYPPAPGVPFAPYASWATLSVASPLFLGDASSPPLSSPSSLTALRLGSQTSAKPLMSTLSKSPLTKPVAKSAASSVPPPLTSSTIWWQFHPFDFSYIIGYVWLPPVCFGLLLHTLYISLVLFEALWVLRIFFPFLLSIHLGLFRWMLLSLLLLPRFLLKWLGPIPVLFALLCPLLYPRRFILPSPFSLPLNWF